MISKSQSGPSFCATIVASTIVKPSTGKPTLCGKQEREAVSCESDLRICASRENVSSPFEASGFQSLDFGVRPLSLGSLHRMSDTMQQ